MKGADRLLVLAAGVLLLAALVPLLPRALPAGADPGHMLAYARGVGGPLRYAPLVPAMLAGASFFARDLASQLLVVKVLAVASAAFFALGIAVVTRAIVGGPRAPRVAFVLALASPLTLYEILWGGLAQFWGQGFALLALAELLRWEEERRPVRAAVYAAATAYAHWYSAAFLVVAGGVVLAAARPWRSRAASASTATFVALAALLALPVLAVYRRIAASLRPVAGPRALFDLSHWPGFALAAAGRPFLLLAAGAVLAVAAARLATSGWPAGSHPRRAARLAIAVLAGVVALLAATPAELAERAYYYAPLAIVPVAAAGLAASSRVARPRPAVVPLAVSALFVAASFGAYADALPYFTPLKDDDVAAFEALGGRDLRRVAVYSPVPNIDAWWLEAVSGSGAASTDLARYFSFHDELTLLHAAVRLGSGEATADLAGAWLAVSPVRAAPAPVSLLVEQAGDVFVVAALDEVASALKLADGREAALRPAAAAGEAAFADGEHRETWASEAGPVTRTIRIEHGALLVRYDAPAGARIALRIAPGPNGTYDAGPTHRWAPGARSTTLEVSPTPDHDADGLLVELAPASELRLAIASRTLTPPTALVPAPALADMHGIDGVYLRGVDPGVARRFLSDPGFAEIPTRGDARILVRARG